jgi:hypothetical protein
MRDSAKRRQNRRPTIHPLALNLMKPFPSSNGRPIHPWALLSVIVAGATLSFPIVAADAVDAVSGEIHSASADFKASDHSGGAPFLYFGRTSGTSVPGISIPHAGRIDSYQVTDSGQQVFAGPYMENTAPLWRSAGQAPDPVNKSSADASFDATAGQAGIQFCLFGPDPLNLTGHLQAGEQAVLGHPILDPEGILERKDPTTGVLPDSGGDGDVASYFTRPTFDTPHVRMSTNDSVTVTVHGDFTIEVIGLSGHVKGADASWDVESGVWTTSIVPGGPSSLDGTIHNVKETFLRLSVHDGTLKIDLPASGQTVQWSGPSFVSTTNDAVHFSGGVSGTLSKADGTVQALSGPSFDLAGPAEMRATPTDGALDTQFQQAPAGGAIVPASESFMAAFGAAFAVLALGALATMLVVRRMGRAPLLADVERALEEGEYRRAASDAARILRRKPGEESALISRAIALSKSGRPRIVVREVTRHLGERRPSDGVLHYVLGLAYQDMGDAAKAERAFLEAVRLTPSLAAEISPRFPSLSRMDSPPPQPDPHGYV